MELIDKAAVVAEINKLKECFVNKRDDFEKGYHSSLNAVSTFIDTLEVKEIDLDALGILAEHLIACDAHGITPIYKGRELDILEGLANNKAQKGK